MHSLGIGEPWLLAAFLGPLILSASGCSWITVLMTASACGILKAGARRFGPEPARWLQRLRWLWGIQVLAQGLMWISQWWPDPYAPLILLVMACILAGKDRKQIAAAQGILRWPVLLLIVPMLLAAIREMKWENLEPQWQLGMPQLVTVLMLLPGSGMKRAGALAVLGAAAVQGVLSLPVAGSLEDPVRELARSLSLMGSVKRFESLVAVGMTLSLFCFLTRLLTEGSRTKGEVWTGATAAGALYLAQWTIRPEITAVGTVILEALIPISAALKINCRNLTIGVDK